MRPERHSPYCSLASAASAALACSMPPNFSARIFARSKVSIKVWLLGAVAGACFRCRRFLPPPVALAFSVLFSQVQGFSTFNMANGQTRYYPLTQNPSGFGGSLTYSPQPQYNPIAPRPALAGYIPRPALQPRP